jgi:ribonuclease P protein component
MSQTPNHRFPPECRLRRPADFDRTYKRRRSASDGRIVLYGCENGLDYCRIGLSVSSRLGGAVVRNRWKRLLREAFRLRRDEFPKAIDLVVVPRVGSEPELAWLEESLLRLAGKVAQRIAKDAPV